MHMNGKQIIHTALAVASCLLFAQALSASPIVYLVTVNTSPIAGTSGYLDFGFSAGADAQLASAAITQFSTTGTLVGAPVTLGDVAGALPNPLTIANDQVINDYNQQFTFGNIITFALALNGPALSAPNGTSTSGSEFGMIMFDNSNTVPLLSAAPGGFAFTVDVNLDGTTTVTTYSPDGAGLQPPAATLQGTPEPATLLFAGLGLAGIALRRAYARRKP
jgi:hypothetical protein